MAEVFWPLGAGRIVTSPFGLRGSEWHSGVDFGRAGGSGGMAVYAPESGAVRYAGKADGYGGPDPAGWLVIECATKVYELGHIVRLPHIGVGTVVKAGQQVAIINPDQRTNGGVAPHLHVTLWDTPRYGAGKRIDPLPVLSGAKEPEAQHMSPKAPQAPFNEYPLWTEANQSRNGQKVTLWLIHTEEGGGPKGGADRLARYCQNLNHPNGAVSYHYYVSQDPDDRGVTVVDGVDTDLASWSVGNANNMSINLCFAGSRASWTREQWMQQAGAIDAAAYLAVQDSKKYRFPLTVITPPTYSQGRAGISDHNYVTRIIGWGDHTDVGPNFPWDYLAQRVEYWRAAWDGKAPAPEPKPPAPQPKPPTVEELLRLILDQLVGPGGKGWPQLGGRTLVDAVAELLKRAGGA